MIISASYKTDIPAFYGAWFLNRLKAGYCKMVNPYGRQVHRVSLKPSDVDGIVFWTKNIGPFLKYLPEVRGMGFPFIVQHTINGYPRALESSVVDARRAIGNVALVRNLYGSRVAVWRYDTILFSSLTPASFHVDNFASLAEGLRGIADEVVISFAQIYKKTRRNLDAAASSAGFEWVDPDREEKKRLTAELVTIARANGMQLTVCSQRAFLAEGAGEARCVDARRMEDVAGRRIGAKLKGNREECGCFESRDIGEYDTCPHGCVYCYAVQRRSMALERYRRHNPDSEFLFEPEAGAHGDRDGGRADARLTLFEG
ncbi:MAG: hypothetical protein IANPNBLG_04054 [Bryobacteraceae bacterium]|nr:hypothetical protein [Bryobacteraceae bacterium]